MAQSLSPGVMHIHGIVTNTYHIWRGMRDRCRNKDNPKWERYGGRGIAVCPEWDDFLTFQRDMGERPTLDHSIERIDNDGDYEPSNCKWGTKVEQVRNRGNSQFVMIDGKEVHLMDAVGQDRQEYHKAFYRMYRGKAWNATDRRTVWHTAEQVAEIKWLIAEGVHIRDISKAYEASICTLNLIRSGKQWVEVQPKPAPIPPTHVDDRSVPYILAIADWKAPYEVRDMVDTYSQGYLSRLAKLGLAKYSKANNTYKATEAALKSARNR